MRQSDHSHNRVDDRGNRLNYSNWHYERDEEHHREQCGEKIRGNVQDQQAEEIIHQAENSRAVVLGPSGIVNPSLFDLIYPEDNEFFYFTSFILHIDKSLQEKIQKGEYIDLAKLLTKC